MVIDILEMYWASNMVGVNMHGGDRERTVSTHPGLSLTSAGVGFCGDTAHVNVEFGRAFYRSGATLLSLAQSVCYVDVRAVWCISRVVIGRLYVVPSPGATLSSLMRASEAISWCERGATSCMRARLDLLYENDEFGRAFRFSGATFVALNVRRVDVRTLPCRQRVDGRWAQVNCRWPMAAGRGSVARVPRYRRAERLLRGRSGGVARLPCRQRHSDHHRFRCVAPCRLSEIGRSSPVRANWKTIHSVARSLARERGARDLLHATLRS
jgi:hypothetical protein